MKRRLSDSHLLFGVHLLNEADPDQSGAGLILPDDLMENNVLWRTNRHGLEISLVKLRDILTDPGISDTELKKLLNDASAKTWGMPFPRPFTPREFMTELARALEDYLRRHPKLS